MLRVACSLPPWHKELIWTKVKLYVTFMHLDIRCGRNWTFCVADGAPYKSPKRAAHLWHLPPTFLPRLASLPSCPTYHVQAHAPGELLSRHQGGAIRGYRHKQAALNHYRQTPKDRQMSSKQLPLELKVSLLKVSCRPAAPDAAGKNGNSFGPHMALPVFVYLAPLVSPSNIINSGSVCSDSP